MVETTPDGVLLVVGSGSARYRRYLLAGAARERPLWLFDRTAPTWQREYIAGATQVDVGDPDALVAAAGRLPHGTRIAGVFCYDESLLVPAAQLGSALGLPGMTVDAAWNCRDKNRTRRVLAAAGVAQPGSVAVASLAEAGREAARIGYPIVLKPRGLGASQGVVYVASAADLAAGYAAASEATQPGAPTFDRPVLVEEYLDGPEISIDGSVVDGRYRPLFLARKRLGPAPYFEETGHVVDADDPLLGSVELGAMLGAAHRALGVGCGMTHTEVRFTAKGPRIVEVNGRLGGDFIPYLGMLATGVDPGRVAARVACGIPSPPNPPAGIPAPPGPPAPAGISSPPGPPAPGGISSPPGRPATGAAGIRFLYPPQDCEVRGITLPGPGAVEGLREGVATVGPGTVLRLPPRGYLARYAYVICQAPTARECAVRLDAATAAVRLDHVPAPPFDPARPDYAWYRIPAPTNAG